MGLKSTEIMKICVAPPPVEFWNSWLVYVEPKIMGIYPPVS
jgi:hypothetical protein